MYPPVFHFSHSLTSSHNLLCRLYTARPMVHPPCSFLLLHSLCCSCGSRKSHILFQTLKLKIAHSIHDALPRTPHPSSLILHSPCSTLHHSFIKFFLPFSTYFTPYSIAIHTSLPIVYSWYLTWHWSVVIPFTIILSLQSAHLLLSTYFILQPPCCSSPPFSSCHPLLTYVIPNSTYFTVPSSYFTHTVISTACSTHSLRFLHFIPHSTVLVSI